MESAKFQFKDYFIRKSSIEKKEGDVSDEFKISFSPSGIINKLNSCFRLILGVHIEDVNRVIAIDIEAIATYNFNKEVDSASLENYFYVNAPALLFPYIRAYISTLTNLSGYKPVNLPTLNLQRLGKELKDKTTESDHC
jgi:preprotein translocase subunit SecB